MTITNWPKHQRPRERLLEHGAQKLSNAELLAIFIRTGVKGKTAVDVANDLLTVTGGIRNLLDLDRSKLCQHPGLGEAKYAQLQAALELSRRYLYATIKHGDVITHSATAYEYLMANLRKYKQEVFACLFLDNTHRVICYKELFYGSINNATVYPREIVKKAIECNASAIILAHNHIATAATPSEADIRLTRELVKILALVDVKILDHIVIGETGFISLASKGYLDKFIAKS